MTKTKLASDPSIPKGLERLAALSERDAETRCFELAHELRAMNDSRKASKTTKQAAK